MHLRSSNASAQAAEYYTTAIRSYADESARIDESIAAIRSGELLDTLVADDAQGRYGWFWQLENLPEAPESRYLYHLLAGHEFQEGLKNYRDLGFMQRNLSEWERSLEAFGDMLDTRRTRLRPAAAEDRREPRARGSAKRSRARA